MKPTKAEKEWMRFVAWCEVQGICERGQYFADNFFLPNGVNTMALPRAIDHGRYVCRALLAMGNGDELEDSQWQ